MNTNEEFELEKSFTKDVGDLEMLQESLKDEDMDKEMIPFLEKFFSIPITPIESCYGHPEEDREPYLSYIEDEVEAEKDKKLQESFRNRIEELVVEINTEFGDEFVDITLEKVDNGEGGPNNYNLRFKIINKESFKEKGEVPLRIIWEKFSKYVDKIKELESK